MLSLETDPRSPEHGQYGFLQELVRHVAYEMLARRERETSTSPPRRTSSESLGDDEVAEVIAAHYVDAFRLRARTPTTQPRSGIEARDWLTRAGERATSLAATAEAQR